MSDFSEIYGIMSEYMQAGFMEAVRAYEPVQDEVRKTEVRAWLRFMRIDVKAFRALEREGLVKAMRKSEGKNSPLYYSKAEIKKALAAAKLYKFATVNEASKIKVIND